MIPRSGYTFLSALTAFGVWLARPRGMKRPAQKCLHGVNTHEMMAPMMNSTDRMVLVPMTQLDDLLELARHAIERLPEGDPLRSYLAGATAAVRVSATAEP